MGVKQGFDTCLSNKQLDLSFSDVGLYYNDNELNKFTLKPQPGSYNVKLGDNTFDSRKDKYCEAQRKRDA